MAKITKRELSRGIKLTNDDATQTFRAVENQIQAGTVSKENLDADESIFRINLNIPQINSNSMFPQATKRNDFTMFSQEDPLISCVAIPFTLPPPQEFIQMNTDGAEEEDHYATDYTDEDKAILLEVFENGNKAIDDFDKVLAKQKMQETLQSLHRTKMQ